MEPWSGHIISSIILVTRRISEIFEGHYSKIEQGRFAERTEIPKGQCDLASWEKGKECGRSQGGNAGGGKPGHGPGVWILFPSVSSNIGRF